MKAHTKAKIELAIDEAVRITESYVIEFFDSSTEERRNRINDLKEELGVLKTCPDNLIESIKLAIKDLEDGEDTEAINRLYEAINKYK